MELGENCVRGGCLSYLSVLGCVSACVCTKVAGLSVCQSESRSRGSPTCVCVSVSIYGAVRCLFRGLLRPRVSRTRALQATINQPFRSHFPPLLERARGGSPSAPVGRLPLMFHHVAPPPRLSLLLPLSCHTNPLRVGHRTHRKLEPVRPGLPHVHRRGQRVGCNQRNRSARAAPRHKGPPPSRLEGGRRRILFFGPSEG